MKWEKLRTSLAAKAAALILLVVMAAMTAVSVLAVGINLERGWYGTDRAHMQGEVKKEIAAEIAAEISYGGYDEMTAPTEGFGFTVRPYKGESDGDGDSKKDKESSKEKNKDRESSVEEKTVLNDALKKQEHYAFTHRVKGDQLAEITVYLGELGNGTGRHYAQQYWMMNKVYECRYAAIGMLAAGLILAAVLVVFLICAAGWTKDGLKANFIDKIPFDLLFAVSLFILMCLGMGAAGAVQFEFAAIAGICALGVIFVILAEMLCMTFVTRVKLGKWWRNTICWRILVKLNQLIHFIGKIAGAVPTMWKTAAAAAAVCLVWMLILVGAAVYSFFGGMFVLFGLIFSIIFCGAVLYFSMGLQKLKEAGEKIAEGDLDYQVDKTGLYSDFAVHADNLNRISRVLSEAVEERMKSESFKTELITNVSHDIKTPLTSIINYVDLLKKEEIQDEKIREYIEVLDRQSHRLKKLSEDLIDASKAASGAVPINREPCQVGVLVTQTLGEYEERFKAADLKAICSLPEEELTILADGRQLWRVFDNLLGNICKYSQQGTRVYISLYEKENKVCIEYKNISKYELDADGETFLERFSRGDRSRHTEGSGLGLSIAQSLVNLQNGTLNIVIDGDLFKVIITFEKG